MDPQKKVVTKKIEGEDQAALAWLKRCLDVDRLSEYIDRNILAFRYLPYAVAIAGVAVLLRSIRLATKFRDCSQIPRSFVRQNVQLRGRLVDVDLAEGTLSVEHQPILSLPSFWSRLQKSNNSSQYLQLRLAFTSPTIAGIYWMRLNVNGAPIKFRLIDHHCGTPLEEDARKKKKRVILWAAVKVVQQQKQQHRYSKLSKSITLNETLIRNGLAEVGGPFPLPNRTLLSKREAKLLHRLELAEAKAVQEGLGLWNDNATTIAASTGTALITVGQQVIRSWWVAIINTLRWALGWLRRTKTTTKEQ